MKYYIVRQMERNGDYEYISHAVAAFEDDADPDAEAHVFARAARGSTVGEWDDDYDAYWYDGIALAYLPQFTEVTEEEYELFGRLLRESR